MFDSRYVNILFVVLEQATRISLERKVTNEVKNKS